MKALRYFEAVARLGSVSKAADELNVTPGAVSQQLRILEGHLGKELFLRSGNSLSLNEFGEELAAVVSPAFAEIAETVIRLSGEKSSRMLRISAPPTVATKWLMPKLGDFYQSHPDVSVVLDESLDLVKFKNDGFDAAIRFADGRFEDLNAELLITVRIHAVASPEYIASHGKLESLQRPEGHYLIDFHYDSKKISSQHMGWEDLVEGDLDDLDIRHLIFPDGLQSLNAAIQGQGIALAPLYLCDDDVKAGELQLLSEPIVEYRNRYYFVTPQHVRPKRELEDFRDWLLDISKAHR